MTASCHADEGYVELEDVAPPSKSSCKQQHEALDRRYGVIDTDRSAGSHMARDAEPCSP